MKLTLPSSANLKLLLYFVEERQRVYNKKQTGEPWPWTKDPILQRFKFCCVCREDDRVTTWIRNNWRIPYRNDSNLWFAMCVARQINWPETLDAIGYPEKWQPERVLKVMRKRVEQGLKNYSSAYMITSGGHQGEDKPSVTVWHALDALYHYARKNPPPFKTKVLSTDASLRGTWEWFVRSGVYGWGPFLAYEVVTDLRHTSYLDQAPDIYTWANAGPGAKRGLNRLYGRRLEESANFLEEMQHLFEWLQKEADRGLFPNRFEMRDVEGAMCELDKFLRARECLEQHKRCGLELYQPKQATLF